MKNILFSTLALFFFTASLQAQSGGILWVGSRSNNTAANAVHATIQTAYEAFLSGNDEKGWAVYSDDAAEIGPDGSITFGKKAMRESWDGFMKIADEAPKFTYTNVQVRLLTSDVALAVWDSEADIKIGGQQMGGKTKGSAVLRKVNNTWKLEFDTVTPVMSMPGAEATGSN
ncbi:MAG: SgcJ/EcaC family oxidoreductase [Lewinellaceae bacterium]|nr:SgcJ/EcaC family oxidoreductase [Lewinellaceae bacterium]